ncbi:unnamed protein product [Arabidopsis halleri]
MRRTFIKQNQASYHSRIYSSLNFLFSYFSTMDSSSGVPVRGHPVQQGYPKMIRTSNIKGTKEQEGDKSNTEGSKKKKIPNTKK